MSVKQKAFKIDDLEGLKCKVPTMLM